MQIYFYRIFYEVFIVREHFSDAKIFLDFLDMKTLFLSPFSEHGISLVIPYFFLTVKIVNKTILFKFNIYVELFFS